MFVEAQMKRIGDALNRGEADCIVANDLQFLKGFVLRVWSAPSCAIFVNIKDGEGGYLVLGETDYPYMIWISPNPCCLDFAVWTGDMSDDGESTRGQMIAKQGEVKFDAVDVFGDKFDEIVIGMNYSDIMVVCKNTFYELPVE